MSAFEDFTRLHHADVVIVMAIDLATGGQVHRQVLVHSVNPSLRDQVRPVKLNWCSNYHLCFGMKLY